MKKLTLMTFIFIFFTGIYVNGYFLFNEPEILFLTSPIENDGLDTKYNTLKNLLIVGAGHFLQSNSDYQLFLKNVELSGIVEVNTGEILSALEGALNNLEKAKETYYKILQLAGTLEYNPLVQEKLRDFDYSGYCEKNQLNQPVFQQVEELLKAGDVRGCYQKFYMETVDILERLASIKTAVETGALPGIPACWRLNQLYLEMELFGQYASEVFMNIY